MPSKKNPQETYNCLASWRKAIFGSSIMMSFESSSSLSRGLGAALLLCCSNSSISTLIWLSEGEIEKVSILWSPFPSLEGSRDSSSELEVDS